MRTRRFPAAEMAGMAAPGRTLLLVIDVQRDFAAPDGAMARWGVDRSDVEAAIGRIALLLGAAREAGVAVGFARVATRPETDSPALLGFFSRTGANPADAAICRAGTRGAAYYRVAPEPHELEVSKRLYSCFAGTGLGERLRAQAVDTLVVTGLTSDCCIASSVREAFEEGFHLFVVPDACADYDRGAHEAALAALGRQCAVLVDSDIVLAGWRSLEPRGAADQEE